jgi:hypothetical protein
MFLGCHCILKAAAEKVSQFKMPFKLKYNQTFYLMNKNWFLNITGESKQQK